VTFAKMPPKAAKAKAAPARSARYAAVLEEIRHAKEDAARQLRVIRARRKNEERRHKRIMRRASLLGASELMEIASMNRVSMSELRAHAAENSIAEEPAHVPPAAAAAAPAPPAEEHHGEF
jgi:DNA topoisomerase VI subunit B